MQRKESDHLNQPIVDISVAACSILGYNEVIVADCIKNAQASKKKNERVEDAATAVPTMTATLATLTAAKATSRNRGAIDCCHTPSHFHCCSLFCGQNRKWYFDDA